MIKNVIWSTNDIFYKTSLTIVKALESSLLTLGVDEVELDPDDESDELKWHSLSSLLKRSAAQFDLDLSTLQAHFKTAFQQLQLQIKPNDSMINLLKWSQSYYQNILFYQGSKADWEKLPYANQLKKLSTTNIIGQQLYSPNKLSTTINRALQQHQLRAMETTMIVSNVLEAQAAQNLNLTTVLFDPDGIMTSIVHPDHTAYQVNDLKTILKAL